ncbi:WRKY transcription factor 19 [Phytophthora cinnamomi]|uniref:WRKY transcription factor 19 n=1 Tax=Phytophthora cinnamomi TaxID=4785 RepID=UPI0035596040|nr:WRKY transcription factor 19 [Phytophthora cinnamomi]KAG6617169.1 WRKY transcription factor 19 [Phytophthora cinnamomi]
MSSVALPPLRAWTSLVLPARANPMATANPMVFHPSPAFHHQHHYAPSTPNSPSTPKLSLSFILDDSRPLTPPAAARAHEARLPPTQHPVTKERKRKRKMTPAEKRAARSCCVEGCTNYTIDRGLCFRHGGGKSCSMPGCTASAKHRGLCWKHGGSTLCTVEGCTRGAKSRGLCWSHGGGTKCSVAGCQKTTISKGLCWTHGGGKRCAFEGCKRPASQSKQNFCSKHQPKKSKSSSTASAMYKQ